VNFIIHDAQTARARNDMVRLPLFVWSLYATSVIMILAHLVLAMTLALMGN